MDFLARAFSPASISSSSSYQCSSTSSSPSYVEFNTPTPLDTLFSLCAGSGARYRLERKRTLEYFESLPDTVVAINSDDNSHNDAETWAEVAGGGITGERVAQPSFLKPWKAPNSGVKFRYRLPGSSTPPGCSSSCSKYFHVSDQYLLARDESASKYKNPRTSLSNTPTEKFSHTLESPVHLRYHTSSFPTDVLPSVVQPRAKRPVLDLNDLVEACTIATRAETTGEPVEDVENKGKAAEGRNRRQDKGPQHLSTSWSDVHNDINPHVKPLGTAGEELTKFMEPVMEEVHIEELDFAYYSRKASKAESGRRPQNIAKDVATPVTPAVEEPKPEVPKIDWFGLIANPPKPPLHCKEYILTANFNPLFIRHTIDPQLIRWKLEKKERKLREQREQERERKRMEFWHARMLQPRRQTTTRLPQTEEVCDLADMLKTSFPLSLTDALSSTEARRPEQDRSRHQAALVEEDSRYIQPFEC
jgi:hypothetical protein